MVSILKWIGFVLLSPLFSVLLIVNSFNAFQWIYVMDFRIVNRTSRPVWITPVGTYRTGSKGILPQFIARFLALPVFRSRNHRVKPGGSRWIYLDRKGYDYYEVVVRNVEGEYRQLAIGPVPLKEMLYRHGESHIIEDWGSLAPAADDVLAAALESGKSWRVWMLFLVGWFLLYFYCWLLDELRGLHAR
jgi:hypothetical protein